MSRNEQTATGTPALRVPRRLAVMCVRQERFAPTERSHYRRLERGNAQGLRTSEQWMARRMLFRSSTKREKRVSREWFCRSQFNAAHGWPRPRAWCHRRLTTPAIASARSAQSPRSRMRLAATRSPRPLDNWKSVVLAALVALIAAAPLGAQPRTDVITLANGDRVTGDVERLDRGRVEFKTDDIGTIYFEWDKVATVVSVHQFEIITTDGSRFLGSLGARPPNQLLVTNALGELALPMAEVSAIRPIGNGFWQRMDGSLDLGFSYTKSSGVAQLNLNTTTIYRRPAFEARLTGSATLTREQDEENDDRATLQTSFFRYRGQRWYIGAGGGVETNDSLGLILRTQGGGTTGIRWVNTNRAQLWTGAGLSVNNEQGEDTDPTQNIEAVANMRASYYTYDRPRTNIDFSFEYYPSLNDFGRQRIQLDAAFKREVWKDFFISLTVFDSFDSRPPNPESNTNDVGVVLSFGWTY